MKDQYALQIAKAIISYSNLEYHKEIPIEFVHKKAMDILSEVDKFHNTCYEKELAEEFSQFKWKP